MRKGTAKLYRVEGGVAQPLHVRWHIGIDCVSRATMRARVGAYQNRYRMKKQKCQNLLQ